MKRKHSGYILAALFLSLCSYIVNIVSVMTESWVVAEATPEGSSANISYINYGLHQGTVLGPQNNTASLKLTCLLNLNICAWTCQSRDSLRREEISVLYYSGQTIYPCTTSSQVEEVESQNSTRPLSEVRRTFIDGVAWLATVVAVILSGFTSLVSLLLTAYNVNHITSNSWVSIRGLYFWFGTSSGLALLALTTWGFEFLFKLTKNIGTVDTIVGTLNSDGKAHLGFSSWCQLGVVVLQGCCIGLLSYRERLFDQRPPCVCPVKIPPNIIITSHLP